MQQDFARTGLSDRLFADLDVSRLNEEGAALRLEG
jgi:hypothetical protein